MPFRGMRRDDLVRSVAGKLINVKGCRERNDMLRMTSGLDGDFAVVPRRSRPGTSAPEVPGSTSCPPPILDDVPAVKYFYLRNACRCGQLPMSPPFPGPDRRAVRAGAISAMRKSLHDGCVVIPVVSAGVCRSDRSAQKFVL